MGYYVTIMGADALIPARNLDEALARLDDLYEADRLKLDPKPTSVHDYLHLVGFDCYRDDDGIRIVYYADNTLNEVEVVTELCDLFAEGSWIDWITEDYLFYRWLLGDILFEEVSGHVHWDESRSKR